MRYTRQILIAGILMAIMPFSARAEGEEAPVPDPTPATAVGLQNSNQNPLSPAGGVNVGSNGDGTALQPAGNNPLQANGGDGANLGGAASQLQTTTTADDALKVLAGETEGPRYEPNADTPTWVWIMIIGLVLAMLELSLLSPRISRWLQRHRHRWPSRRHKA